MNRLWFPPEPQQARALAAEARAALGAAHELASHRLAAVARCAGCDAVIFVVDDGTFVQVQLGWARPPEPGPQPATRQLGSVAALEAAITHHRH